MFTFSAGALRVCGGKRERLVTTLPHFKNELVARIIAFLVRAPSHGKILTKVSDFNFKGRAIPSIKALAEPVSFRYRTTYEIGIWDFRDEKSILLEKDCGFSRKKELVLRFWDTNAIGIRRCHAILARFSGHDQDLGF